MKLRDCTSVNSTESIQEGYRNGLSKTAFEFETVNNNYLRQPCVYQRACELQLPWTHLITRSQLRRLLQNVMTISISEIDSSVSSVRKKLSYHKHVHHNLSSNYASRCWGKLLHVLWDNPFPEVPTNDQKAWKHSTEKYHD